MNVGFVGLGIMGRPMAQHLLKGVAPGAQFGFTLAQKRTDQALKGLD